jgi:hypothetical protein
MLMAGARRRVCWKDGVGIFGGMMMAQKGVEAGEEERLEPERRRSKRRERACPPFLPPGGGGRNDGGLDESFRKKLILEMAGEKGGERIKITPAVCSN